MGASESHAKVAKQTSLDAKLNIDPHKFQKLDYSLLDSAITQLLELRQAVASLISYRFYSGSLLLLYEGDCVENEAAVGDVLKFSNTGSRTKGPLTSKHETSDQRKEITNTHSKNVKHRHGKVGARPKSYPSERIAFRVLEDSDEVSRIASCKFATSSNSSHSKTTQEHASASSKVKQKSVKEITSKKRHRTKSCGSLANCFSSSSHDATSPVKQSPPGAIDIRLIDFAHYCFSDSVVHPGPDGGFLFGIDNLVGLLRKMSTSALVTTARTKSD